jgi:hypothetical protein
MPYQNPAKYVIFYALTKLDHPSRQNRNGIIIVPTDQPGFQANKLRESTGFSFRSPMKPIEIEGLSRIVRKVPDQRRGGPAN